MNLEHPGPASPTGAALAVGDESAGLDTLDPSWLRDLLAACIWRDDEAPGTVEQVRVSRPRHTSRGPSALLTVALSPSGGPTVENIYVAHRFDRDAVRSAFESALRSATITPAVGRAVTLVPDAGLVLVAFPNDPRMDLVTEETLRAWLAARASDLASGDGAPGAWRLGDAAIRILRYVPGQRLTLQCRGRFEAADGTGRGFAYIAKQFRKKKQARVLYENLVALGAHFAESVNVRMPGAIACDDELGLVVMEELPGTDLKQAFAFTDVPAATRGVGEMLAAFHQTPRRVDETLSIEQQLDDVRASAEAIRELLPSAAPRLERCLSKCRSARWDDGIANVLLHGACRPKHVLVDDGTLAFFDLDGMRMGHPAFDVAHFLSALYYLEEGGRLDARMRAECAHRFVDAYAASAPWPMPPGSILRYIAALLIQKQARKYLLHMHQNPAEKVDRVLTLAEAALARAEDLDGEAPLQAIWDVLDHAPLIAPASEAD